MSITLDNIRPRFHTGTSSREIPQRLSAHPTRPELTRQYLETILRYNPLTGYFYWRKRPVSHFKHQYVCNRWNTRYANKKAGYNNERIRINHHRYCVRYIKHQMGIEP